MLLRSFFKEANALETIIKILFFEIAFYSIIINFISKEHSFKIS